MEKIRQTAFRLLLAAVLVSGLLLRVAGLTEKVQLHPDELNIATWMERMALHHSLLPKVYAGGFFVLADAVRQTCERTAGSLIHRWQYFVGAAHRYALPPWDPVAFGRYFNAWLGTLTILLSAFLASRITRSRAGALIAAALMAFAAFAIEHAHYLESDIAMLATLTLALSLMARFLATRRLLDWGLAAFATGFAAGTKFPLALLLAPLLACLHRPGRVAGGKEARASVFGWLALALLLVAAGFVTASPDALHFSDFVAGLRQGAASVYSETEGILGLASDEPHAGKWMNVTNFVHFARSLRAGWLLAILVGIPLCFLRRFRPYWPITVLFPALLVGYMVFLAPWLRAQDFMALLPIFCLWAALSVATLWADHASTSKRALALLLFFAAVLPVLHTGVAMSSQFAWEDTRRLANRALKTAFPPEEALYAEFFAAPAEDNVAARTVAIRKYESIDSRLLDLPDSPCYLLLNPDDYGRGLRDPKTREHFPPYAERMAGLHARGVRLAAWDTLDSPAPQSVFRSPRIELWHRPSEGRLAHEDLGVDLPRPTLVKDEDRTTFFKGDLRAGPRPALMLDKFPREIAIGGPGNLANPVFLIFSTRERAATVRAKGFGHTRRLALGPYDSGAIPMERPWWNPRWGRYERVVVRSETGGPTLTYLPCFLRVAFDPLEAATVLLDDGHLDKAVQVLREQNALDSAGSFWQALAGLPGVRPEAESMLARWQEWLLRNEATPPPALIHGIPLDLWQEFARIRLTERGSPVVLNLPFLGAEAGERRSAWLAQLLPVAGAGQRLAMSLSRHPDPFGGTNFSGKVCLDAGDRFELGCFDFSKLPDSPGNAMAWSLVSSNFPRHASLVFRSRSGGAIRVDDAEFTWNWREMLAVRTRQLQAALDAAKPAPAPFRFGNWLALRECRPEKDRILLIFEALQDYVPPLAARMQLLKRGKWRAGATVSLGDAAEPWRMGARRTISFPLEEGFDPDRTGIAVVTDVKWHSSLLPMVDAPPRRPFPTLAELLQLP